VIAEAVSFSGAKDLEADVKLMLDEESDVPIWRCFPQTRTKTDRIALLLGPEGGFTNEERQGANAKGWRSCSLGRTILRAETAAAAGISVVRAAWDGV
jgi:16S rRNA (uracil1498-N3)-methyltransferase